MTTMMEERVRERVKEIRELRIKATELALEAEEKQTELFRDILFALGTEPDLQYLPELARIALEHE